MNLKEYQKWMLANWNGADLTSLLERAQMDRVSLKSLFILTNGLSGEVGELTEPIKKWIRDYKELDRPALALECGDVLAYLTWLTAALGFTLEEIAEMNVDKLKNRVRPQHG